ncbi:MAG: VWA domain-containing protein [Flavobacteriaceae bacterium]|jgi:nitric oxide reductase NorD protein|nr:VWA domain-containing protein [Flavobacteriaceae bacterium]MBT7881195.1 VWA domain-containing protein [Flavobacteriaceae bacterium]
MPEGKVVSINLIGNLENSIRIKAQKVLKEKALYDWLEYLKRIENSGYGELVIKGFSKTSLDIIGKFGFLPIKIFYSTLSSVTIKKGQKISYNFCNVCSEILEFYDNDKKFLSWLMLIEKMTNLAPEALEIILKEMSFLVEKMNVSQMEDWFLTCLRASSGDMKKRIKLLSLKDNEGLEWLGQSAGIKSFKEQENKLKIYTTAIWGMNINIKEIPISNTKSSIRRTAFSNNFVRVPSSYPGFTGQLGEEVFRAAIMHAAAHMKFTHKRFEIGKLKPIQVAIISIIEDARVELLSIKEFPGLKELWIPYHMATGESKNLNKAYGPLTSRTLFSRLSRALVDENYIDGNGWINRAKDMFFKKKNRWNDQTLSRELGNILGNDIGQMRIQFNPQNYLPDPIYRDENSGIWNFDNENTKDFEELQTGIESYQIERKETDDAEKNFENSTVIEPLAKIAPNKVSQSKEAEIISLQPEFDYKSGRENFNWCKIKKYNFENKSNYYLNNFLYENSKIVSNIKNLIESSNISQPVKLKKQHDGEELDLDSCIESIIDIKRGSTPSNNIYKKTNRKGRDLLVSILVDISESTSDFIKDTNKTIFSSIIEATGILSEAINQSGDDFSLSTFCSNKRDDIRYWKIKDFKDKLNKKHINRLESMKPGFSTRLGAAVRQAGDELISQTNYRKLLLIISDGEPSDIDVDDNEYLVEDAKYAVKRLAYNGIDVFCVGVESDSNKNLSRIFGNKNYVIIKSASELPKKLPLIYLTLSR